ncbi:MAG: DUF177 domain-containing protein [Acidisphaera sp.]|nr:DUF177 domain-containing protein [Acidisphaera sp.]
MSPELSRPIAADRIGAAGLTTTVEATAAELPLIAARLKIPALVSLSCAWTLARGADTERGEVVGEGDLHARVVQTCIVSGDDFEAEVSERFRIRFVRAGTETETEVDADDEVPYQAGSIDLGEAAVEQLALDLDPYPRKPGAALPSDTADAAPSPFAALAERSRSH